MGRQRCLPGRTDGQTLSNLLQNLVWPHAGSAFGTGPSRGPHGALTRQPVPKPRPAHPRHGGHLGPPHRKSLGCPVLHAADTDHTTVSCSPPQSPPFPCSIYFPVALIFEHAT